MRGEKFVVKIEQRRAGKGDEDIADIAVVVYKLLGTTSSPFEAGRATDLAAAGASSTTGKMLPTSSSLDLAFQWRRRDKFACGPRSTITTIVLLLEQDK
jgi:hypothetical protein